MIDELKQWEYDKGYEKGKTDVLDKIRAEISKLLDSLDANSAWYRVAIKDCLKIINQYREEQE